MNDVLIAREELRYQRLRTAQHAIGEIAAYDQALKLHQRTFSFQTLSMGQGRA